MERTARQFLLVTFGFVLALLALNAVVTLLDAHLASMLAAAA